jgi:hypothetical protein
MPERRDGPAREGLPCLRAATCRCGGANCPWERHGLLGRLVRIDPARMIDELLADLQDDQTPHAA